MADLNDVIVLTLGFVAGSIICSSIRTTAPEFFGYTGRETAPDAPDVMNCDKPYFPSESDIEFTKDFPSKMRADYFKKKAIFFKRSCDRERKRRVGDETDGGLLGIPFYPKTIPKDARTLYPVNPPISPPDIVSEFARAYAAAKKPAAGGGKAAPAADAAPPAKSTPAAKPAAGGGGAATGKFPYQPTGKQWQFKDSGKTTRHYASGGSSGTTEWNATGMGATANLMGVVYYTHPASCSGGHGDEADIKMWGPPHSGGACCYCIVNINGAGQVCTGGEGPHPKTTKCRKVVGNVGNVKGKRVGLLHAIWKAGSGAHSEVWIDTGSGFKKVGVFDGACGNAKTSTTPASGQEVQFRCDCTGAKVESAVVYEIAAGSGGGGGASAPAAAPAKAKKAALAITIA